LARNPSSEKRSEDQFALRDSFSDLRDEFFDIIVGVQEVVLLGVYDELGATLVALKPGVIPGAKFVKIGTRNALFVVAAPIRNLFSAAFRRATQVNEKVRRGDIFEELTCDELVGFPVSVVHLFSRVKQCRKDFGILVAGAVLDDAGARLLDGSDLANSPSEKA